MDILKSGNAALPVLTNLKCLYQKTCEKDEENMRKWISVQQDSETSLYEIVQKTPII